LFLSLILKNGFVFDPINGIKGDKSTIFIEDGFIVDDLKNKNAKVVDVSNKIIMPGGLEIHSHVAGGKPNIGRAFRPEDHERFVMPKTNITRSGSGYSTPSTFMTGYLYSMMGYTTVFTPAMPPLMARHTHEELNDLPMVDKGGYTLCDGNWFILKYLREGDIEKCAAYVSWLLKATKGFAIKLTNPGGTEAWAWGRNCRNLDDEVPHFKITPREIIEGMVKVNEKLALPHSVHLHANNLGRPGNYTTTLDTLKVPKGIKSQRQRQTLHITHIQFNSYGGDSWNSLESKSDKIANAINKLDNITVDTGNIIFGDTTTMSADGPLEYYLQSITGLKWANRNVELETSPGVTPMIYSPKMATTSIQWAIGLELPLLIKDPWKVFLATDHPNGGPFTKYPEIIASLMSSKLRNQTLSGVNKAVNKRSILPTLEREYDFYDVAIFTRAGQAKALGLDKNKGHLGVGAHADIAVYDLNPDKIDPNNEHKLIKDKFSMAYLTIKDGKIVVRDRKITKVIDGRTYWIDSVTPKNIEKEVYKDIDYYFKRYYSINLANYPVSEDYITRPTVLKTNA
jgi:formylmethanofuran dehydrogenase subunit A